MSRLIVVYGSSVSRGLAEEYVKNYVPVLVTEKYQVVEYSKVADVDDDFIAIIPEDNIDENLKKFIDKNRIL